MTHLKEGIGILGIDVANLIIQIAESVYRKYGIPCVITEITGGEHSPKSKHYIGHAVDFRTRMINTWPEARKSQLKQDMRNVFNSDFDVIFEDTHLHIEYDPTH